MVERILINKSKKEPGPSVRDDFIEAGRPSLLLTAFTFLSIAPLKYPLHADSKNLGKSMRYFPVVGLTFGLILAGAAYLFSQVLPRTVTAFILILLLTLMSRGMHLDGLADSADGLIGGSTREESLTIMRDSAVGAFGAGAIALALIAKYSLFLSLPLNAGGYAFISLSPALARWSAVYAAFFHKSVRDEGLSKNLSMSVGLKELIIATSVIITAISLMTPLITGLIFFAIFVILTILISYFLSIKIGGVTGDILGAIVEIGEITALFIGVIFTTGNL